MPKNLRRSKRKAQDTTILHTPVPVKPQINPTLLQQQLNQQQNTMLLKYVQMHRNFKPSQRSKVMLRKIANSSKVPLEYRSLPILKLLTQTVEEMIMQEMEIIVWSIYLERFVWGHSGFPFKVLLFLSAYASKEYLNEDIQPFKTYVSIKFPQFARAYNVFIRRCGKQIAINPIVLNSKFQELTQVPKSSKQVHHYNYYVDEILDMAPPYQHENAPPEDKILHSSINSLHLIDSEKSEALQDAQEAVSEEEEPQMPILAKLDSVLGAQPENSVIVKSEGGFSTIGCSWMYNDLGASTQQEKQEDPPMPSLGRNSSLFSAFWNSQNM